MPSRSVGMYLVPATSWRRKRRHASQHGIFRPNLVPYYYPVDHSGVG
jgi:hypothetical protein